MCIRDRLSDGYSHIMAPATTNGKNFMPRVAAKLDVSQVSDISAVISEDTFERPIYAGNCIATVQSTDSVKAITVRTTGFDACESSGGSASVTQSKTIQMQEFLLLLRKRLQNLIDRN